MRGELMYPDNRSLRCLAKWGFVASCFALLCMPGIEMYAQANIGISSPIGWQGTGARYLEGPGIIGDEDLNLGAPNTHSYLEYEDVVPAVYCWKEVEPYSMHGSIDTAPDLPPGDTLAVGGFFRDEIYVASDSGNPVRVEFQFDLEFNLNFWDLENGESIGEMILAMGYYPDGSDSFASGTYKQLDFFAITSTPVEYVEEPVGPEEEPYIYYEYLIDQEDWDEFFSAAAF